MKLALRWALWVLPLFLVIPSHGALTSQQKKYGKQIDELTVRADKGDAEASAELARKYHYKPEDWGWRGLTKEAALAKGFEYHKKAAALNHIPTLRYLGVLYVQGNDKLGVGRNRLGGEKYLLQALALGSDDAQYELAMALIGPSDEEDYRRNLKEWILPLVEKGNADAMVTYGNVVEYWLRPYQPEKAVELYKLAAAKGNIRAKEILERKEKERKVAEAVAAREVQYAAAREAERQATAKKFQELVAKVRADAKQAVDLSYEMANGTWTDAQRIEAAGLLEKFAATGDLNAQQVAARLFDDSRFPFLRNQEKTFHWEMEVAKQQDTLAAFQVGLRYADGNGVARNEAEAVTWFRRAGEYNPNMKPLADWHIKRIESHYPTEGAIAALAAGKQAENAGRHAEAVERFTYAANANLPEAMGRLGGHYLVGNGVPKDLELADFWLRMALNLKPDPATYTYVGQAMTQLREARKEAPIGVDFDGSPTKAISGQQAADQRAAAQQAAAAAQQVVAHAALPTRSIGQRVGDGVVCWVDGSGQHGLILALTEIASGKPGDLGRRPTTFDPQTGLTTWYLPTLDEWKTVRQERRRIEQALEREKGAPLGKNGYYWTDTGILSSGGARGDRVSGNWCYEPFNGGEREQDPYNTRAAVRGMRQF